METEKKADKSKSASPSLIERAAKLIEREEDSARESLKKRAAQRNSRTTPSNFKKIVRELVVAGYFAVNALNGYMLWNGINPKTALMENYNSTETPIVAIYDALKVSSAKENLIMCEYINKNTTTLKAEFNTVNQKGYVEYNHVLLNGLTDREYWYQGGIRTSYGGKTDLIYETWDKGKSLTINKVSFDKEVEIGDKFSLELTIKDGFVNILAKDLSNGAKAEISLDALNKGTTFVASTHSDKYGNSTSIFREIDLDRSFNLAEISPQTVKLISPKVENAEFGVEKRILASGWQAFSDNPKASENIVYHINSMQLKRDEIAMAPKSADAALNKINIGASTQIFYSGGDSSER